MLSALASLAMSAQVLAPEERDWTRTTFAATPICAAGHEACRGTATLSIATEDGGIELERCDVLAGERFVLSPADDAPTFACDLVARVELAGHAPAMFAGLPWHDGPAEVGRWRIPVRAAARKSLDAERRADRRPPGATVVVRLEGGDPREGLATVAPDRRYDCGGELPAFCSLSTPGVRRIDARTWRLDIERTGLRGERLGVVTTRGRWLQRWDLGLAPERDVIVFRLPKSEEPRWIRGRVLDASGAPVAGAVVRARFARHASAPEGAFELGPLFPGTVTPFVRDARWTSERRPPLECEVIDRDLDGLELVVEPRRTIVVGSSGAGIGPDGSVVVVWDGARVLRASIHVTRDQLREGVRVPVRFRTPFAVALLPVSTAGVELPASYGEWAEEHRCEARDVRFDPGQSTASSVRF